MVGKKEAILMGGIMVVLAATGVIVAMNVQPREKASPPVQQFELETVNVNANASTIEFRHTAGDPMPYRNMNVTVSTNTGRTIVFEPPTSLNEGEKVANRDTVIVVSTAPPHVLVAETRVADSSDARMHEVYSSTRSGGHIDFSQGDIDTLTFTFTNTDTGDVLFETSIEL